VIPHIVAIGKDIARLCPDALVLDLANPLAAVCRSLVREAGLTVVGLCEQWQVTLPLFAGVLGVEPQVLDCVSVGTNHLTWALALHHAGRDRLPEFLERIYDPERSDALESVPVSREIYETFGVWPTGTEDHIAEFFPYFLTPETHGGGDYGLSVRHTTPEQMEKRVAEREAMANGTASIDSLLGPSGESAVEIVAACLGLSEPGLHIVNIPNGDLLDDLPAEAIVELPADVGPDGVQGRKVGLVPQPVAHVLSTRVLQQEFLVDAALSGNRKTALQGLVLDAQIVSLDAARRILEQSLAANAEWLPNFA
jgi:alpha-galactosidase